MLDPKLPLDGKSATKSASETPDKIDAESTPLSPATAGTDSPGTRTPTSRRPPRNPYTLFMRTSVPANEEEIRNFFGEAKSGVSILTAFHSLIPTINLDHSPEHSACK